MRITLITGKMWNLRLQIQDKFLEDKSQIFRDQHFRTDKFAWSKN